MADPATYRPAPGEIPASPGVYRFLDETGRVIYVGKAINLRNRLANYFQPLGSLHPRTRQMVTSAAQVVWTVVDTEVEALVLEYAFIKQYAPRFNIKYRDDKSYPYLAVTMSQEYPRVLVTRGEHHKGDRYFGPYSHAWAIRETLDLLLRVFPVRSCSQGVFNRARSSGRPCLLGYIDKCSAPCVGRISAESHRKLAEEFVAFMSGDTGTYVRRLRAEMDRAAQDLDFEAAARYRDDLAALERVVAKNALVLPDDAEADVFGLADDELEAAIHVFHVRGGRIRGERAWVVDRVEEGDDADLIERILQQVYAEGEFVPREVIVPVMPHAATQVARWLTDLKGTKVRVHVPQRGDKRGLAESAQKNAAQALQLHKLRRAGDLTQRSAGLAQLQEYLQLDTAPLRIECYDISTTQGTHQVASMVVFEDGLARKNAYRHFQIRGENGDGAADDTAAMHEVITRRFTRYLGEQQEREAALAAAGGGGMRGAELAAAKEHSFGYPPGLLVVDGGPPQVAAATRALTELGISDIPVVGLAKRLEEVWVADDEFPVILPRTSEALYLLQRVRDEAHRFAITYHRKRRGKAMTRSALDAIPGLGPAKAKALLTHFGSVKRIRAATPEQLCEVPGIGPAIAHAVVTALAAPAEVVPGPADTPPGHME